MSNLTNEAQSITRQAQGAAERFQSNIASLYREDGQPVYSDAQHDALEESYRRERDETFAELKRKAEALEQRAAAAREAAAGADPLDYFDRETIQEAGARKDFIVEEAEGLSLPALTARIKRAAHSGSPGVAYLYQRYASRRHAEELAMLRETGGGDVEMSEQLGELEAALDSLKEKAVPAQLEEDKRKASEAVEAAMNARLAVDRANLLKGEREQRAYSPF